MFNILVYEEAYGKMVRLLHHAPKEVGALMIGVIENGDAHVLDIVVTKQSVTGAHVDFEQEGIDMATMQATMAGQVVIGWFHSHVNMAAFWSGTDMKTINDLIAHTEDYLVSIVANKKLDFKGRIDYYVDSTFGVTREFVDDTPVIPMFTNAERFDEEILSAMAENVTEHIYVAPTKYAKNKGKPVEIVDDYHYIGEEYTYDYAGSDSIADSSKTLDEIEEDVAMMMNEYNMSEKNARALIEGADTGGY